MEHQVGAIIEQELPVPYGYCKLEDILPFLPCRAVSRIPEQARSIIVILFPYYTDDFPDRNVARYAIGDDYHHICGDLLRSLSSRLGQAFPDNIFIPFIDSSPIREVRAAWLAGLGVLGKNGQLIHHQYGSYLFIGSIVTDLPLFATGPLKKTCWQCGVCFDKCPTGALSRRKPFQQNLCRSYITQKKAELEEWEIRQIKDGGLVWGCDLCNDSCPMNRDILPTPLREFYNNREPVFSLSNIERLTKEKAYGYRGKKVLLRNYQILYGVDAQQE